MQKQKYVIFNGKKMLVEFGSENWKEFIVIDEQKVFELNTQFFEYTKEGVNRGSYIDCCMPIDKYNNEINVGDELYACVSGEVEKVKVVKIADKPYHLGYGIHRRKLSVVSVDDSTKKWTLPDGSRAIKV